MINEASSISTATDHVATTITHATTTAHEGFSLATTLGISPIIIATTVLVVLYIVLISERINRAVLALLGAALVIILGVINQEQAIEGISFNTLALLIGMMMIVSITSRSGIFQYVAIKSAKLVNANPVGILLMLIIITAVFSAFLDNVTTVLLIAPITLLITDALEIKVFPFFFAEIIASNVGGTATLIGDPPNIIIGSETNLSFNDFLYNLAPIALVCLVLVSVIILLLFKKSIENTPIEARQRVMSFDETKAITDKVLMYKSLGVLFLVFIGFTVGHSAGIQPGTSALGGAALLLLLAYWHYPSEEQSEKIHHIFTEVEWITIFFFMGLFIVVASLEHSGALKIVGEKMLAMTKGDLKETTIFILWVSAILSAFLDNIPFVATMIPLIHSTADGFGGPQAIEPLWWALALGACFGGNGTLIGASANLTVAAYAEKAKQPIKFMTFFKYAFPIMLLTVGMAHIYLIWKFFP